MASHEPKELKFEGELDTTDALHGMAYGPTVAGRNVIDEIGETFGARPEVRVYLGIEPKPPLLAAGRGTELREGWGGTDVTPGDPPEIKVGGVDLIDKLEEFDGRYVVLVVEDLAGGPPPGHSPLA